jgi:putative hydrolase of HD superfamily
LIDGRIPMSAYRRLLDAMHVVKHLPRKGWTEHGLPAGRVESVGSHTFGTALLVLLLKDARVLPAGVPLDKLLTIALLHDITESVTGDMTPADHVTPVQKARLERDAVQHLFGEAGGFMGLRRDLDAFVSASETLAGKPDPVHAIIKQVDKLDMMIQALVYEKEQGKDMSDFYKDPGKYLSDPKLIEFFTGVKRAILG